MAHAGALRGASVECCKQTNTRRAGMDFKQIYSLQTFLMPQHLSFSVGCSCLARAEESCHDTLPQVQHSDYKELMGHF